MHAIMIKTLALFRLTLFVPTALSHAAVLAEILLCIITGL